MANESIPLFRPGQDISATASAAVVGKRFVSLTGGLLPLTSPKTLPTAAHATAAQGIAGVSSYDAPSGSRFAIQRGTGLVVTVTAGGNFAALSEVEVGANGKAVVKASGVAVGRAWSAGSTDTDCFVELY
jgi:molybdopterin-binding protein